MYKKLYNFNWLFIFIIIILASIGFMALFSAAESNFNPWAKKQIIRFSIFFILLFIIAFVDIRIWYKYSYLLFIAFVLLLFSVEIFGIFGFGAKRWIKVFGLSIQPSEFIKVAMILALARYYSDLRFDRIGKIIHLFFPFLIIGIPTFLVFLQPDLGTSIMILILGISIMFVAGVRIWKFIISFTIGLISIPVIWNFVLHAYQKKRILSFFNPESDPLGSGYHLIQSKIALGSGGVYGKGFMKGSQSYLNFLPEKQTDFIFTMIGEEFGFLGTIFVLTLYFILILICFYISFQSFSIYGRLLAIGIGTNLFIYVILNTSMVTGLVPVVGVPLPLLSYGGSVMLSTMISFGLLLNIAVHRELRNLN